jgi:hypothetical protein
MDSLYLNDMFFKASKLATGEQGSATQFQEFNWKFATSVSNSLHPIVKI